MASLSSINGISALHYFAITQTYKTQCLSRFSKRLGLQKYN